MFSKSTREELELEDEKSKKNNIHSQNISTNNFSESMQEPLYKKKEMSNEFINYKALRMMQNMGYKAGSGLGKHEQGITKSLNITFQLAKMGLGMTLKNLADATETWDFSREIITIEDEVSWLTNEDETDLLFADMSLWSVEGQPNYDIENEFNFCDKEILHNVFDAKNIFDELNLTELCQARARANPFETIRSVFFMNRAALKMANLDAVTKFIFGEIDKNAYHKNHPGPFYFADVCAGPGGFTEYILWRRQWLFKGFGLTLRDQNDFKLNESSCAPPNTFQALYGEQEDGNVCSPGNILDFRDRVRHETDGEGVHFMMSDGGFSVEGKENLQEILSKNIYICQCLVALEVTRTHGNFVTKLFDIFTPFSVGLLYLMYKCFEKVSIYKPNSSRPANSERYFICSNLKCNTTVQNVKKYLWGIVERLWKMHTDTTDILEIVPLDVIKKDKAFYNYVLESNNRLALRQTVGLKKLATFCRNPTLFDARQDDLRRKCLMYWKIPDIPKSPLTQLTVNELLHTSMDKPELILVQPRELSNLHNFNLTVSDLEDWHYCTLYSSQKSNHCNFYASTGWTKTYRLQNSKWVRVRNVNLCRGTLLYGEFVKENVKLITASSQNKQETDIYRHSLHVIDAIRLGDRDLKDLTFQERLNLIKVYCKSVNKESQKNTVRIRAKPIDSLLNITSLPLVMKKTVDSYHSVLPVLGYKTNSENYDVNSLLLLKTNNGQSFLSTYVLRVQIYITSHPSNEEECLSFDDIVTEVKQKI